MMIDKETWCEGSRVEWILDGSMRGNVRKFEVRALEGRSASEMIGGIAAATSGSRELGF